MATLLDVENGLKTLAIAAIYPNGTSSPSVIGTLVRVVVGWPDPKNLESFIANGESYVSIFPTNMEKDFGAVERVSQVTSISPATLTLTVVSNTVTVDGTVTIPQSLVINKNNIAYAYKVLNTDTLNSIAAALGALVPGASVVGNVITITGANRLVTGISTAGITSTSLSREDRIFMITTWSPTIELRDALANAINISYLQQIRFVLPDQNYANLIYKSMFDIDQIQKIQIYRRNMMYRVIYSTTFQETNMTIVTPQTDLTIENAAGL